MLRLALCLLYSVLYTHPLLPNLFSYTHLLLPPPKKKQKNFLVSENTMGSCIRYITKHISLPQWKYNVCFHILCQLKMRYRTNRWLEKIYFYQYYLLFYTIITSIVVLCPWQAVTFLPCSPYRVTVLYFGIHGQGTWGFLPWAPTRAHEILAVDHRPQGWWDVGGCHWCFLSCIYLEEKWTHLGVCLP